MFCSYPSQKLPLFILGRIFFQNLKKMVKKNTYWVFIESSLCARNCAKHSRWQFSHHPHVHTVRRQLLFPPFQNGRHWGLGRINNLLRVMWLTSSLARIWTHTMWAQACMSQQSMLTQVHISRAKLTGLKPQFLTNKLCD